MMDPIKEAFARAKQDISDLKLQIDTLSSEIKEIKQILDRQSDTSTDSQTLRQINTTQNQNKQTENTSSTDNPTHSSTHNKPLKALKDQINDISIGNEGVSTDSQTVKQSDTSTGNEGVKVRLNINEPSQNSKIDRLEQVSQVLSSLDDIKKELRSKFKKLTNQEMAVFTAIYQLEEQGFSVDYSLISEKLEISESSARDYVQRLLKKQIPLKKTKENNKKVILNVSENLRKLTSLDTILQLRSL